MIRSNRRSLPSDISFSRLSSFCSDRVESHSMRYSSESGTCEEVRGERYVVRTRRDLKQQGTWRIESKTLSPRPLFHSRPHQSNQRPISSPLSFTYHVLTYSRTTYLPLPL